MIRPLDLPLSLSSPCRARPPQDQSQNRDIRRLSRRREEEDITVGFSCHIPSPRGRILRALVPVLVVDGDVNVVSRVSNSKCRLQCGATSECSS